MRATQLYELFGEKCSMGRIIGKAQTLFCKDGGDEIFSAGELHQKEDMYLAEHILDYCRDNPTKREVFAQCLSAVINMHKEDKMLAHGTEAAEKLLKLLNRYEELAYRPAK